MVLFKICGMANCFRSRFWAVHDNDKVAIPKGIFSKDVILACARILWKAAASESGPRRWYLVGLHVGGTGLELGPEVTLWRKIIHGREK